MPSLKEIKQIYHNKFQINSISARKVNNNKDGKKSDNVIKVRVALTFELVTAQRMKFSS